jgi:hypothetical protein
LPLRFAKSSDFYRILVLHSSLFFNVQKEGGESKGVEGSRDGTEGKTFISCSEAP